MQISQAYKAILAKAFQTFLLYFFRMRHPESRFDRLENMGSPPMTYKDTDVDA